MWPNASAGSVAWPPSSADRKSTRLNSSHVEISYAVFCLKKKKKKKIKKLKKKQKKYETINTKNNLQDKSINVAYLCKSITSCIIKSKTWYRDIVDEAVYV